MPRNTWLFFYTGGYGGLYDFPDNQALIGIAETIHARGCHGPAGFSTCGTQMVNCSFQNGGRPAIPGLFNRRRIELTIKEEIGRSLRYHLPLSVMLLDIDFFKNVNDSYGHEIGDEVLKNVAAELKENTRSTDLAGRWGGEEFLVVLPQANEQVCRKVTASFGIAEFRTGDDINSLIKRADEALYKAKGSGRNTIVINTAGI